MTGGVVSPLRKNDKNKTALRLRRRESPTNRTEQASPQNVILGKLFCHSWPQAENPVNRAQRDFATLDNGRLRRP
jgi:hypothetical protein